MKKKLILMIVCLTLSLLTLSAKEIYLGFGGSAARDYLTEKGSLQLKGLGKYDGAKFVYGLGPSVELRYYPFEQFRLGLNSSLNIQLITAIDNEGYRAYRNDSILNASVGLSYLCYFDSTLAMFTDINFSYSRYRFARNNEANIREPGDFVRIQEYGIKANLGFLTRNENWYFDFGFTYDYHLSSKPLGLIPLGIFVGGGYIFR